ncbi:Uncharacterised protein [Klebsiella pneumoniae]|nr:Uncharacterised protein [Klebsiella pneumoniae]
MADRLLSSVYLRRSRIRQSFDVRLSKVDNHCLPFKMSSFASAKLFPGRRSKMPHSRFCNTAGIGSAHLQRAILITTVSMTTDLSGDLLMRIAQEKTLPHCIGNSCHPVSFKVICPLRKQGAPETAVPSQLRKRHPVKCPPVDEAIKHHQESQTGTGSAESLLRAERVAAAHQIVPRTLTAQPRD